MAGQGYEVAEVARWAQGIDQVHRCIMERFRAGAAPRVLDYPRVHEGRFCEDCSVRWNARTAGNWRSKPATPLPTGCSA